MSEQWAGVPGFPEYQVSDHGRLRRGARMLKGSVFKNGYVGVTLRLDGRSHKRYIHRLVLEAFVGPCPEGHLCAHYPDRDRTNNRLENLRWDTQRGNMADAIRHGTTVRKTHCVNGHPLAGNQYQSNRGCITCTKARALANRRKYRR